MPPSRSDRRAFTILELLAVIVILAILASLSLPAMARAGAYARALRCRGHLHQWGLATHLYTADHEDRLPPEGFPNPTERTTNSGWYIQLPRQMGLPRYHDLAWRTNPAARPGTTVWLCPANPRRSNGRNLFHYCLNQHHDGTSTDDNPTLLSALPDPASLVWLFDSKNLPAVGGPNFVHTNLHLGGAQFLFLDGHTTRLPRRAYWDDLRDRGRTNPASFRWHPDPDR